MYYVMDFNVAIYRSHGIVMFTNTDLYDEFGDSKVQEIRSLV